MDNVQILIELEGRKPMSKKLFSMKQLETSIIPKDEAENIMNSFNEKAHELGPNKVIWYFFWSAAILSFLSSLLCFFLVIGPLREQLSFFIVVIPLVFWTLFSGAAQRYKKSRLEGLPVGLTKQVEELSLMYKSHGFNFLFKQYVESVSFTLFGSSTNSSNNYVYNILMYKLINQVGSFDSGNARTCHHDQGIAARLMLLGYSRDRVLQAMEITGGLEDKSELILRGM